MEPVSCSDSKTEVLFTADELAQHSTLEALWLAVDREVYDLTSFAESHPGGVGILRKYAGKDASVPFRKALHSARAMNQMQQYRIGRLSDAGVKHEEQKEETQPVEKFRAKSLLDYAFLILTTNSSVLKADLTLEAASRWRAGTLQLRSENTPTPPDHPSRDIGMTIFQRQSMPRRRKGDFKQEIIRLVHSQAHIESFAIDLSWDILLRFHNTFLKGGPVVSLPRAFFDDWVKVAADEAKHFMIWRNRLLDKGSKYGALPVHNGLWESASSTAHSLLARLAVVHMVHEARGLDTAPKLRAKLMSAGDKIGAKFLQVRVGAGGRHGDGAMHV